MKTGWQSRIRSLHFQRYRKIIFQTHLNIKELTPYFSDFDNIGNYLWEYLGLIDLAVYRALIKKRIDSDYAMNLVGDMIWQARVNAKGLIPIIDPLRLKLAKIMTKDPMAFLEKHLKDGMKFPYSEPGYKVELYKDKNVYRMDFYSCPVFEFYKQFGKKEMTLFRKPGVHTITPQPNILLKVEDMGETTLYLMVIKCVI